MHFPSWIRELTQGSASAPKKGRPSPHRALGASRRLDIERLEERMVLTGSVDFSLPEYVATGSRPVALVAADFNGDGQLDSATANFNSSDVSVFLGNGNDTFQPQQSFPAGTQPFGLAVGDFNVDGNPDLAVANLNSSGVSILIGNGDGSFQAPQAIAVGLHPLSIVSTDFNADGNPDLAVGTNSFDSNLSVLLGNGDGTFQNLQKYGDPGGGFDLAVADFNLDGALDLAMVSINGVGVRLGNGDGTFQDEQVAASMYTLSIAVGDFNGDGTPDLALGSFDNFTFSNISGSVLLGNGDGTFQDERYVAGFDSFITSVVVGDFNADGNDDLAFGSYHVAVHRGNGDGTFETFPLVFFGENQSLASVVTGDFNGDGGLDLAFVDEIDNLLGVILNISPQQQALNLIRQVQNLVAAGALNENLANSLLTKLANAEDPGAIGRITAFINEVEAKVRSGKLTAEEGDLLISLATVLLNSLS